MAARIIVEVEEFVLASRLVYEDVAVPLSRAGDVLVAGLDECGGMAGNDDFGGQFAAAYDHAAATVLAALTDVTNGCFRLSAMFAQSGRNYEAADIASTAGERAALSRLTHTLPAPVSIAAAPLVTSRRAPNLPVPVLPGGGGGLARDLYRFVPNGTPALLRHAADVWRQVSTAVHGTVFSIAMQPVRFANYLLPEADDITAVCRGMVERVRALGWACEVMASACAAFAAALSEVQSKLLHVVHDAILGNDEWLTAQVALRRWALDAPAATDTLGRALGPCADISRAVRWLAAQSLVRANLALVPYLPGLGTALAPRDSPAMDRLRAEAAGLIYVTFDPSRLARKYDKHALDFGVAGNRNKVKLAEFRRAVTAFLNAPGTHRIPADRGIYRGEPAIISYDPITARVVIQHPDGEFWSCWILDPRQLGYIATIGRLA